MTTPPTDGLAERLEQIAAYLEHHEDDADDLRAAAARLRQLDRIKAALGPVSNIRRVGAQLPDCTSYSLASLGQWLTGVADALEADDG